jgi:nicotinic acid mononucleotide adenylyltransferase
VIRERAAKGESLEGLVPAAVERYIVKQRLYLQDRV